MDVAPQWFRLSSRIVGDPRERVNAGGLDRGSSVKFLFVSWLERQVNLAMDAVLPRNWILIQVSNGKKLLRVSLDECYGDLD